MTQVFQNRLVPRTPPGRPQLQEKPLRFRGNPLFNAFAEFDFVEVGKSSIRHNQVVYGICIVSRLIAAASRSWNEVREHAIRDLMGWTFWFYATPMLHRFLLKGFAPKDVKDLVIHTRPQPDASGVMGKLKLLNWYVNPLARWEIPTTVQLEQRLSQSLTMLGKNYETPEVEALLKTREAITKGFTVPEPVGEGFLQSMGRSIGKLNPFGSANHTTAEVIRERLGSELQGLSAGLTPPSQTLSERLQIAIGETLTAHGSSGPMKTARLKDELMLAINKIAQESATAESRLDVLLKAEELLKASYSKAIKSRNLVGGVGLVLAIVLLGVGIPLYNVYVTKMKVAAAKKAGLDPSKIALNSGH